MVAFQTSISLCILGTGTIFGTRMVSLSLNTSSLLIQYYQVYCSEVLQAQKKTRGWTKPSAVQQRAMAHNPYNPYCLLSLTKPQFQQRSWGTVRDLWGHQTPSSVIISSPLELKCHKTLKFELNQMIEEALLNESHTDCS